MPKPRLSIIIPSRAQPRQTEFLARAVRSIQGQSIIDRYEVTVWVGVDAGQHPDAATVQRLGLRVAESTGRSQAAALNAVIRQVDADLVAFLEDDDEWMPTYLETMAQALAVGAFVSSTQLEVDEQDVIVRINDFPTPSGWFMPFSTLQAVGPFNEDYRFHLDHEWLGRLGETGLPRAHLVEATAPCDGRYVAAIRPWLDNVVRFSGGRVQLGRHGSPYPLVRRRVHGQSGMGQIAQQPALRDVSVAEMQRLAARFGRVPW